MNKKIFTIEINGLVESAKSVGVLEEKLKNLEKTILNLEKNGVEVPISIGKDIEKELEKISQKVKKSTNVVLPIDGEAEYIKLLKERERALEAVNKELADTGKNVAEYKQETKDLVAQEVKARNEAKVYANTLNGLKAQLKDLNQTKGNIDLGSEEYNDISNKILLLTNRLKELEAAQGSHGRNVGNYKNSIIEASEALNENAETASKTKRSIEELQQIWTDVQNSSVKPFNLSQLTELGLSAGEIADELKRVNKELDVISLNDENYQSLSDYRDNLKLVTDEIKRFRGEQVKADNQLKTQVQKTINGTIYTWENLSVAIGDLEDKLYQLAARGKENTKEFEDIARAASEFKIAMRQVDYQIDSMVESSKGIQKIMSYMQGFTAIGQGAVGLSQLFGMDDENTMKGIQTLQALQGIAQSLQTIQELSKQGTAFGKMLDSIVNKFELLAVASSRWYDGLGSGFKTVEEAVSNLNLEFDSITQNLEGNLQSKIGGEIKIVDPHDIESVKELANSLGLTKKETDLLIVGAKQMSKEFDIQNKGVETANDIWDKFKTNLSLIKIRLKDLLGLYPKVAENARDASESMEGVGSSGGSLIQATKGAKLFASALRTVSVAAKGLAMAIAATGILVFIQLIGWLVEKMKDWGKAAIEAVFGNDKLVNSVSVLEGRLESLNKQLEYTLKLIQDANREGRLTDLQKAILEYEEYSKALEETAKQLKKYIELRGEAKKLESIENYSKIYEALQVKVESGEGGRTERVALANMQKRIIEDIQYQIANLDLSKGMDELDKFFKLMSDGMYASSFLNIEELFPEEEWAKVLKKRIETLQDFYNKVNDATQNVEDVATSRENTIRSNYTEAIYDDQTRELEALKNARKAEIEAAKGDYYIIHSINLKYDRLELELIEKHNKEKLDKHKDYQSKLKDLLRQIRDNYLSAENESLNKTIQEINNARQDAIDDAIQASKESLAKGVDMTEQYNALIKSINAKYDSEITKAKKEYYQNLLDEYDNYTQELIRSEQAILSNRLDNKSQTIDIEYAVSQNTSDGMFDFDSQYSQRIDSEKRFNETRLSLELQYLKDRKNIENEYAKLDKDDSTIQEENRYKQALKSLRQFKESGKATEEEYNKLVEKEHELHKNNILLINEQYDTRIELNEKNHQNEVKETISTSLKDNVSLYQLYVDEVDALMSNVGKNENIFGLPKISESMDYFKQAKTVVKDGLGAVEKERQNLNNKLKNEEISFIDYKDAIDELDNVKDNLKAQGEDIDETQKDFIQAMAENYKSIIDGWVSQISSMLSLFNESQMQMIDNELEEINRQLEIQEEAYQKAEEAANAHKDIINGIEDELADARGARRQALIDNLAQQQKAYLEDIANQQAAMQEKQKIEERQKQLEKKRREQEKKSNVQQALINTYMSVSNALAVQPWQLGLALSAVALALGMKNVTSIKSTPIYEDGGVLVGNSHAQGGIKVLNGAAEVEGGEYVVNKKSTATNLPLLEYVNSKKRAVTADELLEFFANGTPRIKSKATSKFKQGGQLPTTSIDIRKVVSVANVGDENKTYVVSVVDIVNAQEDLEQVRVLSGLK